MFFEPPPAREDLTSPPHPALPAWFAPPAAELGVTLGADRVLAHSPHVAVALTAIRAYSTGCLLHVEIVLRQHDLTADGFWELQASLYPLARIVSDGGPLPGRLLRFGVRYAGGTKATTVEGNANTLRAHEPPATPQISWMPGGSAMRSGRSPGANALTLWLWPLPPPEPFELAVEWPLAGIGLTFSELDGGSIGAAARRSAPYWPVS